MRKLFVADRIWSRGGGVPAQVEYNDFMHTQPNLTDKIFKDKNGRIVLTQTPNLPLWAWIAAMALAYLFSKGRTHSLFSVLAYGALFTWSYLEIRNGVNYFRRFLGVMVLVVITIHQIL